MIWLFPLSQATKRPSPLIAIWESSGRADGVLADLVEGRHAVTHVRPSVAYVRDRVTGTLNEVGENTVRNTELSQIAISGDGRFVAWDNGNNQIVVINRVVFASHTINSASFPSLDGDGGEMAYATASGISLYDTGTGTTTPITTGGGYPPVISADGTHVAHGDTDGNIDVYDVNTGTSTVASVASDGTAANAGSFGPSISADGNDVAFTSTATNLVAGDDNGVADVFQHDMTSGATTRVSVANDGSELATGGAGASISGDGTMVAFLAGPSFPYGLFVRSTAGTTVAVTPSAQIPVLSGDGHTLVFTSTATLVDGVHKKRLAAEIYAANLPGVTPTAQPASGPACTITGTPGNDVLNGTARRRRHLRSRRQRHDQRRRRQRHPHRWSRERHAQRRRRQRHPRRRHRRRHLRAGHRQRHDLELRSALRTRVLGERHERGRRPTGRLEPARVHGHPRIPGGRHLQRRLHDRRRHRGGAGRLHDHDRHGDPASGRDDTDGVDVPVIGDRDYEPDETMSLVLSNPVAGTLGDATGTGTILNDDPQYSAQHRRRAGPGEQEDVHVPGDDHSAVDGSRLRAVSDDRRHRGFSGVDYHGAIGVLTIPAGATLGHDQDRAHRQRLRPARPLVRDHA